MAVLTLERARRRYADVVMRGMFLVCAAVLVVGAVAIPIFIASHGLATFHDVSVWTFLTGTTWQPDASPPQYGALPFLVGSLAVTALAILMATPLAVGAAHLCHAIGPDAR